MTTHRSRKQRITALPPDMRARPSDPRPIRSGCRRERPHTRGKTTPRKLTRPSAHRHMLRAVAGERQATAIGPPNVQVHSRQPGHVADRHGDKPVVLRASEVLDQTQQVQPTGGDGLAEPVVGEPIELPQDGVALLIEKRRRDLLLAAGSWLAHRLSGPLRFSPSTRGITEYRCGTLCRES